ncbi:tRNA-splicing ligase RtcB [Hymenobacter luteus]|uniref:3'-phosphate/5'-hydroxy nucleic acid ligase n=2 Tax=Hymenobacter TaxID=89966 RepID=A0A7W9WDA5_9BACT|nr:MULTISPECIES: RtcB family protein [Hymenobacter]MBB4603103.1 tRNA-splicing ligase RtcB [Hymenobacter latericoloratus]MBB6060938.1 tRNA-splicing ligase RtcB [Hymenobacter luteus]
MATQKLRGNDLRKIGYPEGRATTLALDILEDRQLKKMDKGSALALLQKIKEDPYAYLRDSLWRELAKEFVPDPSRDVTLSLEIKDYRRYGEAFIEDGARKQMDTAMKLPVTLDGALMPDAHQGYGLPIGGVLAVDNAVIPYGVGMDIGCRMALSVFELPPRYLDQRTQELKKLLHNHTRFGAKEVFKNPADDPILDRPEFREIPVVKGKREAAINQLGSSGSGNHFVEWGIVDITTEDNELGVPIGQYLGLLSHSGSRGLGAAIAQHYTKVAMQKCPLPPEARYLAWLDLDSQEGQEYWRAMNLAGDYASACHRDIHRRLSLALGEKPLAKVENHHNFAWKETLPDGREAIVHRKGATPAGQGVLGVIPGSMTAPGFIVRGRGEQDSIQSASHGAGRRLSRTQAKQQVSEGELRRLLRDQGIELIGGGLDEAPQAYKDIHQVMAHQQDLVDVLGSFRPRIVRMDAGGGGKSKYGGE